MGNGNSNGCFKQGLEGRYPCLVKAIVVFQLSIMMLGVLGAGSPRYELYAGLRGIAGMLTVSSIRIKTQCDMCSVPNASSADSANHIHPNSNTRFTRMKQ